MNNRLINYYFAIILLFYCNTTYSKSNNEIFEPNDSVKVIAQKFDEIYFPIFLETLSSIKENDTVLISKYYNLSNDRAINITDNRNLNNLILPVIPIYPEKFSNFENFPVTFPIIWKDTIHKDATWRLWYQSLRWLDKYLNSNSNDSLLAAFYVINDWIKSHDHYPVNENRFAFDDHAVAERMVILYKAYDSYNQSNLLLENFEHRLLLSLLSHIFFVASLENYKTWHNHAIIFDEKLINTLENFNEFVLRSEFLRLAFLRVFEQYRYSFTAEGIHKEHSPCYHIYFTSSLNSLIKKAKLLSIEVPSKMYNLQTHANNYSDLLNPIGYSLPIGDCSRNSSKTDNTFLSTHADNNIKVSKDNKYIIYPSSGWAFILNNYFNISIVMQSDFYSKSHYQQDETSFILNVDNYELIIDPGMHSYNKNEIYDYYRSASAHNLLLVDDNNFSVDLSNTGLSGITRYFIGEGIKNTKVCFIEMTHPHYFNIGVKVYRQFYFSGSSHIKIKDIAYSETTREYSQLYHLAPNAIVRKSGTAFYISWPHHPYVLKIKSNEDRYEVIYEQKEPMQGWYFPKRNHMTGAPVLLLNKTATNLELTTEIEIIIPNDHRVKKRNIKRNMRELSKMLNVIDRKELYHQPVPIRWKTDR